MDTWDQSKGFRKHARFFVTVALWTVPMHIWLAWIGLNSLIVLTVIPPAFFAVKSKRTRSPAATRRVWPSRSASVSSLRGRRFPTRSKRRANSWSWRTSSTPSSRRPEPFTSPAPPRWQRCRCLGWGVGWVEEKKRKRVTRAGARYPNTDRLLQLVLFWFFSLVFLKFLF